MKFKVTFEAETLPEGDEGSHGCSMAGPTVPTHAARWFWSLRIQESGTVVVTAMHEKAARHGYSCDAHLYPTAQFVHNEIQSTHSLRDAAGIKPS